MDDYICSCPFCPSFISENAALENIGASAFSDLPELVEL